MKNLEKYIEEATKNITEDRAATKTLLMTVMKYIQSSAERHRESGLIAAKYLETLQRSNEQLVKLAALIQKKENSSAQGISAEDRKELFDLIQEEGQQNE